MNNNNLSVVLVLEDEPSHIEAIRRAFENNSTFEIHFAASLSEGIASLSSLKPDIVLADLNLPDGQSIAYFEKHLSDIQIPFIIMTSYGNEQSAVRTMKAGALNYIVKSPDSLVQLPYILEKSLREWDNLNARKKMEEELKASRENFESLFNTISEYLFILDFQGKIIECNSIVEEKTGRSRKEILGTPLKALHPESVHEEIDKILPEILENNKDSYSLPIKTAAGELIPVETKISRGQWDGKPVLFAISRDISGRLKIEQENMAMERKLLNSQKLESLGVLAGGIAHDFNNLLTAIIGNLELIQMQGLNAPLAQDMIGQAIQAGRRASDLTRQMLAYSGKGRFIIRPIDINYLIKGLSELVKSSISKNVVLHLNLPVNIPPIMADSSQIEQIIMNLLINASEAIGDKTGIINLMTGVEEFSKEKLDKSRVQEKLPPGKYLYLNISDSGCGMKPETLDKIFDPFYSTKFTGRGLGMSAVMGIVKAHKGAIFIESEDGKGTDIKVLFPIFAPEKISVKSSEQPLYNGAGQSLNDSKGTLLIADDEMPVRNLCKNMLEYMGYNLCLACDGIEAVELFKMHQKNLKCALLDLNMPNLDGLGAFSELRKLQPDLKIILMSGYHEDEIIRNFSGKRFSGFLRKPFDMNQLKSELERLLKA